MAMKTADKLNDILTRLDELRDELFLEYKRISGAKLQAQQPTAGTLHQVENALKVDIMMVSNLRKELAEYFKVIYDQFKIEFSEKLSSKEQEVKRQLDNALSNIDRLKDDMHFEEDKIANEIQSQLEHKYKQREQALVQKLKAKRQEDIVKFQEQLKTKEAMMQKDLMAQIENVERLREEITTGSKKLEEEVKEEVMKDTKVRERNLIKDLENRMNTELSNLEVKYKSRIDILENELQRAQKKIKELRNINIS